MTEKQSLGRRGLYRSRLRRCCAVIPDGEETIEETADDLLASEMLDSAVEGEVEEKDSTDQPPRDRFLPSSIGLTVVLPQTVSQVTLRATWGNYKTEPRLPDALLIPELSGKGKPKPEKPENLRWVRVPGEAAIVLDVTRNQSGILLPESADSEAGRRHRSRR